VTVVNLQAVGDEDGLLLPAARAIRVRSPLTVTHVPEAESPGMVGNGQSVRAYQEIGADTSLLATKAWVESLIGATVTKSITLSANNTTAAVPIFTLTGIVRAELYGVVTTAIGSNHTAEKFQINDGTLVQDISVSTGVDALSSAPVGTLIARVRQYAGPLSIASTATGGIGDPDVQNTPFLCEFIAVKKSSATTQIEYVYTTTNTPTSGAIKFYCKYLPLSDDGAVVAT
jgi:hypothetical protein